MQERQRSQPAPAFNTYCNDTPQKQTTKLTKLCWTVKRNVAPNHTFKLRPKLNLVGQFPRPSSSPTLK